MTRPARQRRPARRPRLKRARPLVDLHLDHGPAEDDGPALDRVADVLFEILAEEG